MVVGPKFCDGNQLQTAHGLGSLAFHLGDPLLVHKVEKLAIFFTKTELPRRKPSIVFSFLLGLQHKRDAPSR